MAFLRVKKIKGNEYAYLVESRWDPESGGTRQHILEYLGPVRDLSLGDVPEEYRNEATRRFVLRHSMKEAHRRARLIERLRGHLLAAVLEGDAPGARRLGREGLQLVGLDQLYVQLVTPVMHEVGELWARREIPVSQEHLATNTMAQVLAERNAEIRWAGGKRGVAVVCTPEGERHKLAAPLLAGLLMNRGYQCLDVSDTAPTASVAAFVRLRRPDFLLVSVTMVQHLFMVRKLIDTIREALPGVRLLLGGQALSQARESDLPADVPLCGPDTLAALDEATRVETE